MHTRTDSTAHSADAEALFAAGNTNELEGLTLAQRRRWPYLLTGVVLGAAAALAAVTLLDDGDRTADETVDVDATLATAPVEIRDLVEEVEWTADLGYGPAIEVTAAADTVITATSDPGTVLTRGDTVFAADDEPVTLLYGDLPLWRRLADGSAGPDVEQLETNLVALGYDPDTTVTIDDDYTTNTALMVERWQTDIGAEATGTIELGSVVVAPGPVSLTSAPTVGLNARAGSPLASLSLRLDTTTVVGAAVGSVETLAPLGTPVMHGSVLYEADGIAVLALTELDTIASYLIDPNADIAEMESALAFSGHDPDGLLVIDTEVDAATEAAVSRWQDANGLTATGVATAAGYVLVDPGLEVTGHLVAVDDITSVPRPIIELGSPTLSVVIPVALADQDAFTVGQGLTVELPDETIVDATVIEVGTIARAGAQGGDATIDVTVELTQFVGDDLPASPVTVTVAGETVADALVVPTRSLVTLAEGGFAVDKVLESGATILVAVETGTFDDGVVQVTSSQLEPGDALVVPQ